MNRTIEKNGVYAITISPPYRKRSPDYLYSDDKLVIRRLLNKCSRHYLLYPEFDERSRLHYHGIVYIHDLVKWHKHVKHNIDRMIGFTLIKKIRTIDEHIGWINYCKKGGYTYDPIVYVNLRRKRVEETTLDNVNEMDIGILVWVTKRSSRV